MQNLQQFYKMWIASLYGFMDLIKWSRCEIRYDGC